MSEENKPEEIIEFPSGLKEYPGGKIPIALKLTYIGFALFGIIYFAMYIAGDGSPLVELLNQATGHAGP